MRFSWKIATACLTVFCLMISAAAPLKASGSLSEDVAIDSPEEAKTSPIKIVTAEGGEHDFTVELALTPIEQATGLMYRTELVPDQGMLFIFPDSSVRHFWMKNTLIPLDMLFIRKDGTIAHIHEKAVPQDLRSISSRGPVKAVLEVRGGTVEDLGLAVGDRIVNSRFFQQ